MKDYLFAYGTLGEQDAPREIVAVVKRLRCLGEGFILGRLYDLGEYPGAILGTSPNNKVFGKVYEIPADSGLLARLDAYEEFDPQHPAQSLFVRRRAPITRSNKKKIKGWVYEYNGDVRSVPLVKSGHYSPLVTSPR